MSRRHAQLLGRLAFFVSALILSLATSCTVVGKVQTQSLVGGTRIELRGDSGFSPRLLSSDQRALYDLLWSEIGASDNKRAITDYAESGDIYTYSRELYSHIQSILIVFRLTGDLELLDYVDSLAQHMRDQLEDGWSGTTDGTDGTTDGYLNWVDRRTSTDIHRGKDTWQSNDMGAHALVATIAYALEANRDLTSPTGRNYGAHADFWKDYLVNHFEAKWRAREGVRSGFPIMTVPHTTTYYKWIAWHHYMGRLTGDNAYTNEANRMAEIQWAEHFPIDTPSGTAYVWARSLASLGGAQDDVLHPTTYARHVFGLSVDFHLDGFHNWAAPENMARLARTFTELIVDSSNPLDRGMAADVGGEQRRLLLTSEPEWSRLGLARYRDSNFGLIGAWDPSGRIRAITMAVHELYPSSDTTRLVAALFVDSWLNTPDTAASSP
jgi:hypothetical protein